MSFSKKRINVMFTLQNGSFGLSGGNQATVTGLRVSCQIKSQGGPTQGTCELAIFGMPLDVMNQLSTVGTQYSAFKQNSITVEAGDAESGMWLAFAGDIVTAYVDGNAQPNVCLRVSARPGHYYAMKPEKPTSIKGSADAAGMMQTLAGKMGLSFENSGVNIKFANPYFPGSILTQALDIAKAGGFDMIIERGTMAIVPPEKSRNGTTVLLSPETGMIGYPQFEQAAVVVTCLPNPDIKFLSKIQVQSELTSANATWTVNSYELQLESETPRGKWLQIITAISPEGAIS